MCPDRASDLFGCGLFGGDGDLRLMTGALVYRVLLDGARATGVTSRVNNVERVFRARGEVILAAGTVQSPKLLQLSGIGPGDLLSRFGIRVLCDSPEVGSRMRDHLGYTVSYRLLKERGNNHCFYGLGLIWSLLRYYATRGGPMATGPFEVGAFVRTTPRVDRPNAQLYLGAFTFAPPDDGFSVPLSNVEKQGAGGIRSVGHVIPAGRQARDQPAVHRADRSVLCACDFLEHPGQLRGREIRVDNEPGHLAHTILVTGLA